MSTPFGTGGNQQQSVNDEHPGPSTEPAAIPSTPAAPVDRRVVITRQKQRFGGMKAGPGFFGWLTATGMAVLLIALLTAAGVVFGVATDQDVGTVTSNGSNVAAAQTLGLVGGIALLVVLFVAYYCGGYVAGRMARFNGARQGLAVWLWGMLTAVLIAGIAAVAGAQYNVLAGLNLPRIPVNEGQVSTVGLIAIGGAILLALIGALLGGLAGMRFHRKVDAVGLDAVDEQSHADPQV